MTRFRITPAGAGKTPCGSSERHAVEDHPRRCGENRPSRIPPVITRGSPPQVRGKQVNAMKYSKCERITPAGAGKTCTLWCSDLGWQDHPRRCGENSHKQVQFTQETGSPPQVRGKLTFAILPFTDSRITPAGAGKTYAFLYALWISRDHPRRCGENFDR